MADCGHSSLVSRCTERRGAKVDVAVMAVSVLVHALVEVRERMREVSWARARRNEGGRVMRRLEGCIGMLE